MWHLTFISLSCTCSKNLFMSHFPQGFCLKYLISPSFTFWFFCSHICYEFLRCHIFHRSDVSNTLFHHLSHLVSSVAVYLNEVICLPCSWQKWVNPLNINLHVIAVHSFTTNGCLQVLCKLFIWSMIWKPESNFIPQCWTTITITIQYNAIQYNTIQ